MTNGEADSPTAISRMAEDNILKDSLGNWLLQLYLD